MFTHEDLLGDIWQIHHHMCKSICHLFSFSAFKMPIATTFCIFPSDQAQENEKYQILFRFLGLSMKIKHDSVTNIVILIVINLDLVIFLIFIIIIYTSCNHVASQLADFLWKIKGFPHTIKHIIKYYGKLRCFPILYNEQYNFQLPLTSYCLMTQTCQ